MGVVTVSSSASRTPLGLSTKLTIQRSTLRKPLIVAFKTDEANKTALVAPQEKIPLPIETRKKHQKRLGKARKLAKSVKSASTDVASPCTLEVDYNEAAAKLENLYKRSPETEANSDVEDVDGLMRRGRKRRKKTSESDADKDENRTSNTVVRNRTKKAKRLSLNKRVALKWNKDEKVISSIVRKRKSRKNENEKIEELVREYSTSTDLVSLDWKKMKIPPVLTSSEHAWLFKLMQPMKVSLLKFPFSGCGLKNWLVALYMCCVV